MPEPLIVEQGFLHAYRVFDVADEIDLDQAVKLSKTAAVRLKLQREGSQFLEMTNPPVAFLLGNRPLGLKGGPVSADVVARLFDHGAISVLVRIPIPAGTSLAALVAVADEVYDSRGVDELCRAEADKLCQQIAAAMKSAHTWEGSESYHVVFVERFRTRPNSEEVLADASLARLILGETGGGNLSGHEHYDVTKHSFSYFDDDLAVVDWNAAFVYEPSGSRDIPDILEIATAQLLELRYYDDLLDRRLAHLYDEMEKRRRLLSLFKSDYARLRREVMVLMLEVAEFTERVENSLKVIGDFYLARVYQAAVHRFRIPAWGESVDRKEALVAQIYELLNGEVEHGRMLLLEVTIVVLILAEILMAVAKLVG